ncbi:MAG TPA: SDR family oxidoreductase [Blastocatellia bacterium]|nr:SDR family oxidoreductase [Blastocatellia bacterium]
MPAKSRGTALITGASGGIGADLAELFARDGFDLVLVARSRGKLDEIGARLAAEHGIRAVSIEADLSAADAPERIAAAVQSEGLTIDALINNAGFGLYGPFAETDLSRELEMIALNVTALTHLTKLFLPGMLERRKGWIMNVASTAAFQPGPLMAVYYATKAYVLSFSEALHRELSGSGVAVSALCPGPTATGFVDAAGMHKSKLFKRAVVMSSMDVATIGYRGLMRGKSVVVTGWMNKVNILAGRLSPRGIVTWVVMKMQEPS